MNVHDFLKDSEVSEIKEYCNERIIPVTIGMTHIMGDFNLGTLVRNANFFGMEKVVYIGGKKSFDRRSTVGTHHYTNLSFFKTEQEFLADIEEKNLSLICIENNVDYICQDAFYFDWTKAKNAVILFGEEQKGIPSYILDKADYIVSIPAFGSVRSLNVGTASGIIMGMIRQISKGW